MRTKIHLKIKRLSDAAVLPALAHPDDAGLDLTAISVKQSEDGRYLEYGTGLAVEIPSGHVGLLFPRSSVSKTDLTLANCVGVIDAGYRGEIRFRFRNAGSKNLGMWKSLCDSIKVYELGDRIGQLIVMPIPLVTVEEVGELGDSDRGTGGFGSTG